MYFRVFSTIRASFKLSKMQKPFHSFGIGSDIVDGFEIASRERVLDLIFKLTTKIGERAHDSRI